MDSLHQRNVKVFLISGGFRCIVEHVAAQLNIPQHHVYANRLKFYFNGETWNRHDHFCKTAQLLKQHKGFTPCDTTHKCIALVKVCVTITREWRSDADHLLLRCCYLPGEYAGFDESQPTAESGGKGKVVSILKEQYGFKTVVMIGDGATDLEACPPAVSVLGCTP